jgi:hypothetical protein
MEIVLKSLVASGFLLLEKVTGLPYAPGCFALPVVRSRVVHGYSIGIGLKALKANLPLWAFFVGRKRLRRRVAA